MGKKRKDRGVTWSNGKFFSLEAFLAPEESPPSKRQKTEKPANITSPPFAPAKNGQPPHTGARDLSSPRELGANIFMKERMALPIWPHREAIREALLPPSSNVLILVGEPGSGKSTQVPQFLRTEPWCSGMIAVTQPRRIAATSLAHRVAKEVGSPLGKGNGKGEVGYSVRFESRLPPGMKIKYLTEGMLLKELLKDPGLRQYSAVIVDEVHERSVDTDLLLGFLKQIRANWKAPECRDGVPLKVVVMSATANVEELHNFFAGNGNGDGDGDDDDRVESLTIPGRQHDVEIIYTPDRLPNVQTALVNMIFDINRHQGLPGDILVFLEGQEEITSAQSQIEKAAAGPGSEGPAIVVFPLYGQLSNEAQQRAFQPVGKPLTRKVILATNIAETSVTVPGVRYVIDCGIVKVKQFRPQLGMESLLKKCISKSSAIQRAGRAGREAKGRCYRLYTEETYNELQDVEIPEMLRADPMGAVLLMKARGVNDISSFPLLDMLDQDAVRRAEEMLWRLGALSYNGLNITDIGRKMAQFPVSAPFARVLIAAADPEYDCVLEVIDIISCLTAGYEIFERLMSEEEGAEVVAEFRKELFRREGDLLTYLTTMQRYTAEHGDRAAWCKRAKIRHRAMKMALDIRRQLRSMCTRQNMLMEKPPRDPQPFEPTSPERAEVLVKCFLEGFFHHTAVLKEDGSYKTTKEDQIVAIHPSSVLRSEVKKREAIMFVEHVFTAKNYARKVTAIQADWIVDIMKRGPSGEGLDI